MISADILGFQEILHDDYLFFTLTTFRDISMEKMCIACCGLEQSSAPTGSPPRRLVSPRTALLLSAKVTKMRLLAGSSGTAPLAATKTPKVGVALLAIVVVAVAEGACRHAPVVGLV